jgi:fumarate hydratase class II
MNANEVIAHLANAGNSLGVHPNDDVNMCQSSNDVIPTAIQVSACLVSSEKLIPALNHLLATLESRAEELAGVANRRTHSWTRAGHVWPSWMLGRADPFGHQAHQGALKRMRRLPRVERRSVRDQCARIRSEDGGSLKRQTRFRFEAADNY